MSRKQYTDIPPKVKAEVLERDKWCVFCGKQGSPNAHYLPRSKAAKGIEQNILTLCWECHNRYDHTTERQKMMEFFQLFKREKIFTPDWDEEELIYRKWHENENKITN